MRLRPWFALLWLGTAHGCNSEPERAQVPVVATTIGTGGEGGETSGELAQAGAPNRPDIGVPCNGSPALCGQRYDQVTFPVVHAAMANDAEVWRFPAQNQPVRQQLDDSMRGIWLEVRPYAAQSALCWGDCADGHTPLVAELREVHAFLADNPREVVTIFVDNFVPAQDVMTAFSATELDQLLYTEATPEPWPTLAEMVDAGTRLVVFVRDAEGASGAFRPFDAEIRQTSAQVELASDLSCDLTQGAANAPFVLLNQFLEPAVGGGGEAGAAGASSSSNRPNAELAATVGKDPELTNRLKRCLKFVGQKPNFVAVDFYDKSDVVTATQRLNGLIP